MAETRYCIAFDFPHIFFAVVCIKVMLVIDFQC